MNSKKKNKSQIMQEAEAFTAMVDAKMEHPQSFFERIFSVIWKIFGWVFVPIPCLILTGIIIISGIVCVFINNELFHGAVLGAVISDVLIIIFASIEHGKDKS